MNKPKQVQARGLPRTTLAVLPALAVLLLLLSQISVHAAGAVPRGGRLLGVDVNAAQDGDYNRAFSVAKTAGMQATSLVLYWDQLEPAPQQYGSDPNWLEIANLYYPAYNTTVLLSIAPIDTVNSRVPSDLVGHSMDDPVVIERFKALLDHVFSQIPDVQLAALSLGQEVDLNMGTDAGAWAAYERFFAEVANHARALRPGLQVGVQTDLGGTISWAKDAVVALNRSSDVVVVSYYPMKSDFTVKPVSVVRTDWAALVNVFPDKPIIFAEVGYPSGLINASSQSKQGKFVEEVFKAWDDQNDHVPLIVFVRLCDVSNAQMNAWADYYRIPTSPFRSFLKTLGLRTENGVDKTAFTTLKKQAVLRGW